MGLGTLGTLGTLILKGRVPWCVEQGRNIGRKARPRLGLREIGRMRENRRPRSHFRQRIDPASQWVPHRLGTSSRVGCGEGGACRGDQQHPSALVQAGGGAELGRGVTVAAPSAEPRRCRLVRPRCRLVPSAPAAPIGATRRGPCGPAAGAELRRGGERRGAPRYPAKPCRAGGAMARNPARCFRGASGSDHSRPKPRRNPPFFSVALAP